MVPLHGANGPIDDFMADFARRLRGPVLWRRRVLEECRDGLECSADDLAGVCPDRAAAEREAVRRWGPAEESSAEFNEVALGLRAANVAGRVLYLVPVLIAMWVASWALGADDPWQGAPASIDLLQNLLVISVGIAFALSVAVAARNRRAALTGAGTPRGEAIASGAALVTAAALTFVFLHSVMSASVHALNWPVAGAAAVLTFGAAALTVLDLVHLTALDHLWAARL